MPSLLKKGNRISRLVADLQTTPKRGGSLVVETGFPTSLVDLFVKNREKLKKHKSKKSKSKKHSKITQENDDDFVDEYDNDADDDKSIPKVPSVSNSSESSSDLEVPRCSIAGKYQKNDSFVDDDNNNNNNNDSCKNDASIINDEKRVILDVSNEKNMVLFSILVGLLVLIVVLYTKRWFLAFVTFGVVLLLLLDYVGNPVIKLFKPCENAVSMSVLKGGLAVVVALYTKWFVVGITMGASMLLLLEYAGNSGFGWFKPCNDAARTLQGFLSKWGAIKRGRKFGERDEKRRERGFLKRSANIGSRKEGENQVVSRGDVGQGGVGDGVASRKEIEPKFGSKNFSSKKGIGEPLVEDGDVIASKGVVEQGSRCSTYVNDNSWLLEEDSRDKPMHELLALEMNGSKKLRSSCVSDRNGYIALQGEKGAIGGGGGGGGEEGNEDTKTGKHKGKGKKGKKFWKKLVPKRKNKKNKHKNENAYDAANVDSSIHDTEADLDEEDEVEEGEQEISEAEGSSTLSSYEQDDVGSDIRASRSSSEMLEFDNSTTSTCGMIKEQCGMSKYLALMMIPLTGLIWGRMFAVAFTVISCLVFKIVRG